MSRLEVLRMFRSFLREARHMPTENRRKFIERKVRHEFRANSKVLDRAQLEELVLLGQIQLDNVRQQAQHLNALKAEGNLKS